VGFARSIHPMTLQFSREGGAARPSAHKTMFYFASPCQILSKSFAVLRLLLDGVNSLELQRDVYPDFTLRVQTDDFGGA
jgi:hypothetical protein